MTNDETQLPDTSENESPEERVRRQMCAQVAALRKKKGWTLEQLSAASGVSRSMLSQIERNQANPTLGVAHKIATAFGLTLGELVKIDTAPPQIEVIRADDPQSLFRSDADCRIRTLSPLHLEKDVEFYELVLRPGGALRSAAHFQGTREFLTVQQGSLRVISGKEQQDLHRGDSAHYPADVPHAIENTSTEQSIAFLVVIYRNSG